MPKNAINVGGKMFVPLSDLESAQDRIAELERAPGLVTENSIRSAIEHVLALIFISREMGRVEKLVTRDEVMSHFGPNHSAEKDALCDMAKYVDLIIEAGPVAAKIIMTRNS